MTASPTTRRSALLALPFLVLAARVVATPKGLPPALADLRMPGATLKTTREQLGERGGKVWRTAGRLPNGETQLLTFPGTLEIEFGLPYQSASDAGQKQIVEVFRHYDAAIRQRGGKRIDQAPAPQSWLDVNARLFVYSLPTADGDRQLGLWVNGHAEHWLMLFPATSPSAAPVSSELAQRINAFGHAPIYINFDTGRAELKADGQRAVAEVATLLKADADLKLSVEGHTDNVGDASANRSLSLARAQSVRSALLAQGIAGDRLLAKGHGQDQPVADNARDEGRARNRRVELVRLP